MQVIERLERNVPLPWEEEAISDADREALGVFLPIILPLLHRVPAQRGTVADFRRKINRLVELEP